MTDPSATLVRVARPARAPLGLWVGGWLFFFCLHLGVAQADEPVRLQEPHFHVLHADKADPGSTFLDAQFEFDLPSSLREAVEHGVPLYFNVDLEVSKSRWYWFDKRVVSGSMVTRLSYSPLTRQYRLTRGGLALPFESLDQAVATLRRVVQWRIGDGHVLDGDNLHARLRLHLDVSMLPKPFQVSALTDRDWSLDSEWLAIPAHADPAVN
jgi:hypothetical protein